MCVCVCVSVCACCCFRPGVACCSYRPCSYYLHISAFGCSRRSHISFYFSSCLLIDARLLYSCRLCACSRVVVSLYACVGGCAYMPAYVRLCVCVLKYGFFFLLFTCFFSFLFFFFFFGGGGGGAFFFSALHYLDVSLDVTVQNRFGRSLHCNV